MLTALAKPTLRANRTTRALGKPAATASAEPSVEVLSTTITSYDPAGLAVRRVVSARWISSRVW